MSQVIRLCAPMVPGSKSEVRLLGIALYTAALLKSEIQQLVASSEDKIAVIRELYNTALALAMYRANYSYGLISEELGIPEKLARKYVARGEDVVSRTIHSLLEELFSKNGCIDVEVVSLEPLKARLSQLEREHEELKARLKAVEDEYSSLKSKVEEARKHIESALKALG
ncbi:MAG: transcriptional regulator [Desulfurococcus sp.]|nr:transcriptional regulator [Desulfurococcus sp.]